MHEKVAKMLKTRALTQGNVPTIITWPAILPRFLSAVWGQIIVGEPLGQTGRDDSMGGVRIDLC